MPRLVEPDAAEGPQLAPVALVRVKERLDGKFLLRSADPMLSAEDIVLGYKQLLEVERA